MGAAMPRRIVANTPECALAPDRVVTGARLGLTQSFITGGAILLVPAWLFEVRGEPHRSPSSRKNRCSSANPQAAQPPQ